MRASWQQSRRHHRVRCFGEPARSSLSRLPVPSGSSTWLSDGTSSTVASIELFLAAQLPSVSGHKGRGANWNRKSSPPVNSTWLSSIVRASTMARADECRKLAKHMPTSAARKKMLEVAADYDPMADRAESIGCDPGGVQHPQVTCQGYATGPAVSDKIKLANRSLHEAHNMAGASVSKLQWEIGGLVSLERSGARLRYPSPIVLGTQTFESICGSTIANVCQH
jgi:hypothetical protein